MKNADFPWRKVQFTKLENGDYPRKKCDFPLKNGDFPIKNGMPLGPFLLLPVGPVSIALGFKSSASPRSLGRLQNCLIRWLRKTNQEAAEVAKHHVKKKKLDTLW